MIGAVGVGWEAIVIVLKFYTLKARLDRHEM